MPRSRSRRIALIATAVAATGAATVAVVTGTASAAGTGTCTDTVKVRSEPSKTAPVVGTCQRGQAVRTGETKSGFVKLDEFGGWASATYVKSGSEGTAATPNKTTGGGLLSRGRSETPAAPETSDTTNAGN